VKTLLARLRATSPAARAVFAAVAGPLAATAIAANANVGPFGAPTLYLLSVVAAAAVGGVWSGFGAAIVSFLGLNYYFTAPTHTLRVDKVTDLAALLVFLAVGGIVGELLARALAERARAERREVETQILHTASTKLLAAESLERAVTDLAHTMRELFGARACAVYIDDAPELTVELGGTDHGATAPAVAPVAVGAVRFGSIRIERGADAQPFSESDRRLLSALADQLGLALERRRLDNEARAARTQAEISQIRAALFSSVTHDLRTPLASIKAGVTSLMDEDVRYDAEQRRELLRTVLEETDRLNRLVGNLLNLARARAGGLAIEKELTPIEDVIEPVLTRMRGILGAFDVKTEIANGLPAVWVDPLQMDQALTNILENAAHHSARGDVIGVNVVPWRDGIRIAIADNGPGIPPQDRELVFEPFFRRAPGGSARGDRGDAASDRRIGTGLGLAIARAVVQAHDGSIHIEGAPGEGATIVIELPRGTPSQRAAS
jgi:two-component system sensor histidine kinase KdpD